MFAIELGNINSIANVNCDLDDVKTVNDHSDRHQWQSTAEGWVNNDESHPVSHESMTHYCNNEISTHNFEISYSYLYTHQDRNSDPTRKILRFKWVLLQSWLSLYQTIIFFNLNKKKRIFLSKNVSGNIFIDFQNFKNQNTQKNNIDKSNEE